MIPLSSRQREMLGHIDAHLRVHGWPPTVRELGAAMGTSYGVAIQVRDALARKGRIRVAHGRSRGITRIGPTGTMDPVKHCRTCGAAFFGDACPQPGGRD